MIHEFFSGTRCVSASFTVPPGTEPLPLTAYYKNLLFEYPEYILS